MPRDSLIQERQAKCKYCGRLLSIPLTNSVVIIKCDACGTTYQYNPETRLVPKLVINRGTRAPLEYSLNEGVAIVRERGQGYVKIRSIIDSSIEENTYLRNPCVSFEHARIAVQDKYELVRSNEANQVIARKKCSIEDLGSFYGTSVNDVQLKPNDPRELKHNDQIVLSPGSDLPLRMLFRESL